MKTVIEFEWGKLGMDGSPTIIRREKKVSDEEARKIFIKELYYGVPVDFGTAIQLLKEGFRVYRKGWNGKNQYIELASWRVKTETLFSSASCEWETPQDLFDRLNAVNHFTIDVAATDENHKCERYYTRAQDGLTQSWAGETVWCNPPYGREIINWVKKAKQEQRLARIVMLLPARTDTKWFWDYIYLNAGASVTFIRGRLKFGNAKNSAPFPSMVVTFDERWRK